MLKATINLGMMVFDVASRLRRQANAPDALRPSVERNLCEAERKDILARDRDLTERVKALLDAKDAEAKRGAPGPAARAVQESPDIALYKAILIMRKAWQEAGHRKGDRWTDGQLKSIDLLMAYCLESVDTTAEFFLIEVQEKPFFRSAREKVQVLAQAIEWQKRQEAQEKQAAAIAAQNARLDALYARYRATPGANCRDVPELARFQVPQSDYQRHLESLGPEPYLWHDMATDLHECGDDRLAAIYWIMDQPECDVATVSEFIGASLHWDLLEHWVDRRHGKISWQIAAFCRLIDRWNRGEFTTRRISRQDAFTHQSDKMFGEEMDDGAIERIYARNHQRFEMVMPEVPRDLRNAMRLAPPKSLIQLDGPWRYNPNGCKIVPSEQFQA